MSPLSSTIAGVTFDNPDGSSRQTLVKQLRKREFLKLVDASSPQYPEAIGVYNSASQQLGFIPKDDAEYIRLVHKDIDSLFCIVRSVGRTQDYKPYGAQIIIADSFQAVVDKFNSLEYPDPITINPSAPSDRTHTATTPTYNSSQRKSNGITAGCIVPSIIGLIIAIVIIAVVYK